MNIYKLLFSNPALRIAIVAVAILFSTQDASVAQLRKPYVLPVPPKDTSYFWIFKDVTGGPYFTVGYTRQNVDLPISAPPVTWTSSPRFAYQIGGTIDFSPSDWYGFDFSMLYDSRDLYLQSSGDSASIDLSLGYLSIQPSIRLFWLLVGFSFDIPLSGSATEKLADYQHADQPTTHTYSENLNVQTSDIESLTELRATLSIPILQGDGAMLHLIISGSYPLSKTMVGTSSYDTTGYTKTSGIGTPGTLGHFSGSSAPGKGPLPAIEAGLSYQFDMIH